MCKKYQQYQVKITYLNGDTENISYEHYDNTSYKDMLSVYKDTKEKFKNDCVTIDFIGISENGQLGILFQKEITNEKELKIKEEAETIENLSANELISKLDDLIGIIGKKQDKENGKINVFNKKQDILLHKVEIMDKAEMTDREKLNLLNELYILRKQRREAKNNALVLSYFTNNFNLKEFKKVVNETKQKLQHEEAQDKKIKVLTDEELANKRILKEYPYKNFKDRVRLMKILEKQYDKLYFDDVRMVVTAYNKANK